MAETKTTLERVYTIPLRKEWMKVPSYKRARKGVLAVKQFLARHMKVSDRNLDNVKLDTYLNNELWSRGSGYSPSHVTVKAIKDGDVVKVTFVEDPAHVRFAKARHEKRLVKNEKKAPKAEEKVQEAKTTEETKAEAEKEASVAVANEKAAEQQAKASKHVTKAKQPEIHRMALKK